MLHKFDAYRLAVQFYRDGQKFELPSHLKAQFARSSSSIVLNLAEGSGRAALADRRHFFAMALGPRPVRPRPREIHIANSYPKKFQPLKKLKYGKDTSKL